MKIVAKPIRRAINEDGQTELTLLIENYRNQQLVKELEKDKDYRIELNVVKSKRSMEQNKLLWALIHDISKTINGDMANDLDDWDIYLQALERAGAKYEVIACLPESEKMLKQQFRAVKVLNTLEVNGRILNSYKVYYGSSKMNSKEMTQLIDTVLDMAANCGIDTAYYEGGF